MTKTLVTVATLIAAVAASVVMAAAPPIRYFPHPGAPKPFSSAVRVGNLIYISGATGRASDGSMPADFSAQAANTMDAIGAELKLAGASMDDVYKCSVALTDMNNWDAFNAVYVRYFKPDRLPVRMAIGVVSLGGAAVEVQCEAAVAR
jgi:enamine deaminase RidA (YjgF/YER057c/UK114 family)